MSQIRKSLAALVIAGSSVLVFSACEVPADPTATTTDEGTVQTESEPKAEPKPKAKPKPVTTRAQREALESAESYLESGSFSKKGLASQLRYEEFSKKDVAYAIDHVKANYNHEARESAESYLDSGSFSRSSLTSQLLYEKFTKAQVAQAVESVY